jgi:hypothetical protein
MIRTTAFLIAFPMNALFGQAKPVRSIDVGGYALTLGMTTAQLIKGLGAAFKYQLVRESRFIFSDPDGDMIAAVDTEAGTVWKIVKLYGPAGYETANKAFADFVRIRKTANCTVRQEGSTISEVERVDLLTNTVSCGNVSLVTSSSYKDNQIKNTGYSITIVR